MLSSLIGVYLVAFIYTSCISTKSNNNNSEQFSAGRVKATRLLATDPQAAIILLDSLVKVFPPETLADTQMVVYAKLKSEAFLKLDMKDSAYSFMQQSFTKNPAGTKNAVKIFSGLWLARNYSNDGNYDLAQKYLSETMMLFANQIAVYTKSESETDLLNARLEEVNDSLNTNPAIFGIVLILALVLGALLFRFYFLYRQRDTEYNVLFEKFRSDTLPATSEAYVSATESQTPVLIPEESDTIYPRLLEYFETGKPYLRNNLRFDDVANELRVNRKILSHLIQKHTGMNFNSFVNSYRTKEAIQLLAEPKLKQYKIEAIAHKAGFGSKASFYLAFNQITGSVPSEHR